MAIRIDVHRKSRIWKIGNDKGVYYGQFHEKDLRQLGKKILAGTVPAGKLLVALKRVINPMFHDEIPEIAKEIRKRVVTVYPAIRSQLEALPDNE